MSNLIKEGLSKLLNSFSRHTRGRLRTSGVGQNQVSNNYLLDAGCFGLHVLSRHFLHPVGRIHQHDDIDN